MSCLRHGEIFEMSGTASVARVLVYDRRLPLFYALMLDRVAITVRVIAVAADRRSAICLLCVNCFLSPTVLCYRECYVFTHPFQL